MRLTIKIDDNEYLNNCFPRKAYRKLGQLEDIEDELGIDLITFVKLITATIVYIKNYPFSNDIEKAILLAVVRNDIEPFEHLVWFEDFDRNRYMFPLTRYGKGFALTKEELEENNEQNELRSKTNKM